MPSGFHKKRSGKPGSATQVNKPNGQAGSGPHKMDDRENNRVSSTQPPSRDTAERIWRDRRGA